MEYLVYLLGVFVVALLCLAVPRVQARNAQSKVTSPATARNKFPDRSSGRDQKGGFGANSNQKPLGATAATDRDRAPAALIPWGWPRPRQFYGDGAEWQDLSGALQSFTERLVRQKELASGQPNDPRVNDSIRALLEDRYGRVWQQSTQPPKRQRLNPPVPRDPGRPFDQLDNQRSGEDTIERVTRQLHRMVGPEAGRPDNVRTGRKNRSVRLEDMRAPWGW